jgi:hypothetical protein
MKNLQKNMLKISIITTLLLSASLVGAQSTTLKDTAQSQMKPATKAWTTLYYLDADYNGGFTDPLQQLFIDEINSTSNVNVVVIQDTLNDPAFIYYIDENHTKVVLEELGEVNMGDYQVLQEFLAYGKQQYPAERYLLWVYDHGGAWKGACLDETDGAIGMTLNNFQKALAATGGVDIICFLACLMSSIEAVYELRNDVDVFVGSEDLAYMTWFDDICGDTNQLLTESPTLSNEAIGSDIVQYFQESHNAPVNKLTISALRTENIASLATALDDLAREYTKHWLRYYPSIKNAYNNTFLLSNIDEWASVFEVYDLRGFIENLPQSALTQAALDAFDDVLITEAHGIDMEATHGLSIFFQPRASSYGLFRDYRNENYGLDFAQDTFWNEFLFLFILTNVLLKK